MFACRPAACGARRHLTGRLFSLFVNIGWFYILPHKCKQCNCFYKLWPVSIWYTDFITDVLEYQSQTQPRSCVSLSLACVCKYNTHSQKAHVCRCFHIFIGTWHVLRLRCPFASSRARLPKMSHWIFNMWTNLMMAGTQSMMALIIQNSTAESSRPPQGLWLLPQNLLTSILLCSSSRSPALAPLDALHLWLVLSHTLREPSPVSHCTALTVRLPPNDIKCSLYTYI